MEYLFKDINETLLMVEGSNKKDIPFPKISLIQTILPQKMVKR